MPVSFVRRVTVPRGSVVLLADSKMPAMSLAEFPDSARTRPEQVSDEIPPRLGRRQEKRWEDRHASRPQSASSADFCLTPRQLEVLALLCDGLPNKLISQRLNISASTVKVHISCIMRELGVSSRLQVLVVAQRCGLVGEAAQLTPGQASRCPSADSPALAEGHPEYGTRRLRIIA
jgi:DNA-binding CsgD family transcriptional regulator